MSFTDSSRGAVGKPMGRDVCDVSISSNSEVQFSPVWVRAVGSGAGLGSGQHLPQARLRLAAR